MPSIQTPTYNPIPKDKSFLGKLKHAANDFGRYLQRSITSCFVDKKLVETKELVKKPLSDAIKYRNKRSCFNVVCLKLFVGSKAIEDFNDYANWHTHTFQEKSSWNKYKTFDIV